MPETALKLQRFIISSLEEYKEKTTEELLVSV